MDSTNNMNNESQILQKEEGEAEKPKRQENQCKPIMTFSATPLSHSSELKKSEKKDDTTPAKQESIQKSTLILESPSIPCIDHPSHNLIVRTANSYSKHKHSHTIFEIASALVFLTTILNIGRWLL